MVDRAPLLRTDLNAKLSKKNKTIEKEGGYATQPQPNTQESKSGYSVTFSNNDLSKNYAISDNFLDFQGSDVLRARSLVEPKRQQSMLLKVQSYNQDPENINSSDSDSDISDEDTTQKEKLRKRNTYCGIEIKKQFGLMQLISIFFLAGSTMMIGVYMNAQLSFMLPLPDYFNIPSDQIGMQTSNLMIYSIPFSLITTFFISYAFELLGRKFTISVSYICTGIIFFLIPYSKPYFWLLAVMRCAIGVTMAGPISHPLINDYICKNSRGKALAVNGLGTVFGEVISMGVLLKMSKSLSYEAAFAITASIIVACGLFYSVFIKNPNLQTIQNNIELKGKAPATRRWSMQIQPSNQRNLGIQSSTDREAVQRLQSFQELTLSQKISDLTYMMKLQLSKKPILYIVILGAAITRLISVLFSTYLILWINKEIITNDGTPEEQKEQENLAKDVYINIMVISALICVFVLPILGKLCDTIDPRKIMPIAFLARCWTTYMFWLLEDPLSFQTLVVCISMVIASLAEQLSCDSIFMKNLNKETRGVLSGAYSFVGQIGILIFSLAGGWMFDNLGSKSPFVAIGALDFGFAFVFCSFMLGQRVAQGAQATN